MEQKLYCFFREHPNAALSRTRLLREVWNYEASVPTRTVDTHVKNLRKRLGKCGGSIVTVRGIGYRFEPDHTA